jgi:hypothetical protein
LWAAVCFAGAIVWLNFYDDFTLVELGPLTASAEYFVKEALSLLGVVYDQTGPKALCWDKSASVLGAVLDLSSIEQGIIFVKNKESRVVEIVQTINEFLGGKTPTYAQRVSLRGRLGFAEGQLFGRRVGTALRVLAEESPDCDALRRSLIVLKDRVSCAPPRQVSVAPTLDPVFIFTDGACSDVVSQGAVLFDPVSGARRFFGCLVEDAVVGLWSNFRAEQFPPAPPTVATSSASVSLTSVVPRFSEFDRPSRQVIGQAEILPVVVSLHLWSSICCNRLVIVFVDNESAKDALTSGTSPVEASSKLLEALEIVEDRTRCSVWFSRVPSESNISDDASRLIFQSLLSAGFVRDEPGSCWAFAQGSVPEWTGAGVAWQEGSGAVFQ